MNILKKKKRIEVNTASQLKVKISMVSSNKKKLHSRPCPPPKCENRKRKENELENTSCMLDIVKKNYTTKK